MFTVSFIAGGVIGSVATYVYKDEPARKWTIETSQKFMECANNFIASFKKKPVDVASTAEAQAEPNVSGSSEVNVEKTEAEKH